MSLAPILRFQSSVGIYCPGSTSWD
uniref:Uncharacterized protein n=1 Tax=Arundo donax TaxID=35708 RepID=A0A0A8ZUI7_ARUDO